MHNLISKAKRHVRGRSAFSWIIFLAVLFVVVSILPVLVRAIRNFVSGLASLTDAGKEIASGVSEKTVRWLAALGLAKSPYADALKALENPSVDNCWSPGFWRRHPSQLTSDEGFRSSFDDYMNIMLMAIESFWNGYDMDKIKSEFQTNLGSQSAVSYMNDWMVANRGVGFLSYINNGFWYKLSDKDTVEIGNYALTLPVV